MFMLASLPTFAQTTQPAEKKTLWLDYWMEPVPASEAIFRIHRYTKAGQQLDSVFKGATMQVQKRELTTWVGKDSVIETQAWRANGKLWFQHTLFVAQKRLERSSYDAAGLLRRQITCIKEKEIQSMCFDDSQRRVPCVGNGYEEKMPEFPGGQEALLSFIGKSVRYPGHILRPREQGRVVIKFIVDEAGAVRNVKVQESVSPALDAEAVRVISSLPVFTPGMQNGEFVPVRFMVPVTFQVR